MTQQKPVRSPLLALLLWDAGVPLVAYYGLRLAGQSEQNALLAGAVLAALRMVWVAVRHRSFDGFAALLATVLAISLALSFVTGDTKFLLVKESFGTAAAALILLASCASRTPLVLVAVRAGSNQAKRAEIDQLSTEIPQFRQAFVRMSAAWGVGLLLEAVLRVPLVYLLPADVMTGLSLALLLTVIGLLSAWTAWYANRVQTRYAHADGRHPTTTQRP
ncbi:VC0807 family protein [Streptomyces sp. CA-288835]|uniref:VC0807 family protein n=1 Tax=Streptomyces sp. CA-288835 TaxID=3240069 RepID=UPI003D8FE176